MALGWLTILAPGLEAASPIPVVDLLPEDEDRKAAEAALTRQLGWRVELVAPEPTLLEPLRWQALDRQRAGCEGSFDRVVTASPWHASVQPPADEAGLFPGLLESASWHLVDLELEQALETLQLAREVLPCVQILLARDQIRALFVYQAVVHFYLKDGKHPAAFEALLTVDPRTHLELDYPPRVQAAFREAVAAHLKRRPMKLEIAIEGGEVYLDGERAEGAPQVWGGRHVLQVKDRTGHLHTAFFSVPEPDTGPDGPTLADLRPVGAAESRAGLAVNLAQKRLEPAQEQHLKRYLERRGCPSIAFAVGSSDAAAALRIYHTGKGLTDSKTSWLEACGRTVRPADVRATRAEPDPDSGATGGSTTAAREPADPRESVTGREPAGREPDAGGQNAGQAPDGRDGAGTRPSDTRPTSSPDRHVELGVGLAAHNLLGSPDAWLANGRAVGYALRLELAIARWRLGLRGAWVPHIIRPAGDGTCSGFDGQVACLPDAAPAHLAVGLGRTFPVGERLEIVAGLHLQGSYLPNTLLADLSGPGRYSVAEMLMLGPVARARAAWRLSTGRVGLIAGLELSGGALFAPVESTLVVAVPLGAALDVGVLF